MNVPEQAKRNTIRVLAWLSWFAALAWTAEDISDRVHVFLIGAAIALGLAMSRYKLSDTIVAALTTGYALSEEKTKRHLAAMEKTATDRHDEAMGEARAEVEDRKIRERN